jgi:C4-dicarboxylate-specific signal transduction histidine kinase
MLCNDYELRIQIHDNGVGISSENMGALFEPYHTTKEGGSGLGLALSQQLAQQAGGRIELVRSDVDGTVFRLAFGPAS